MASSIKTVYRSLLATAAAIILTLAWALPATAVPTLASVNHAVRCPAPPAIAVGVYPGGTPLVAATDALAAYTTLVGRAPTAVMWYQDWTGPNGPDPFPRGAAARVAATGAVPLITWDPSDGGGPDQPVFALRRIAAGDFDRYLRTWALSAAAWGGGLYLRPMPEMNGYWSSWSVGVNGNTAADYIAAWRHIVSIFRSAHATAVRFVWSPNIAFGAEGQPGASTPFEAAYPGDAWVDWVALDGYNWGTSQPYHPWQSFAAVFGPSYARITALTKKPLMIAETASTETGGSKSAWISDLARTLPTQFPRVRALVWFDENKAAVGETDWRVNSSPSALAAWRALAAAPSFGERLP